MSFINKLAVGCAALLLAVAAVLVVVPAPSVSAQTPVSATWDMTCSGSGTFSLPTLEILTGTITGSGSLSGDLSGDFTFEATYNEADEVWCGTSDLENGTLTVDGVPHPVDYFAKVTPSNFAIIGTNDYPDPSPCSFDITGYLAVWTTGEPYIFLHGTISGAGSGTWSMPELGEWGDWELTGASGSGTCTGKACDLLSEPVVESVTTAGSGTVTLSASPEHAAKLYYDIISDQEGEKYVFLAKSSQSYDESTPPEVTLDTTIWAYIGVPDTDIDWPVELWVYYTNEEVSNAGIDENTLKLKKRDVEGETWVYIDDCWRGTDDENGQKYVAAYLYELSPYTPWGVPATSSSMCFIATAAYGSYLDSHVDTLQDFRDQYLVTNPLGSGLVSLYYKLSPPLADFIEDHPASKPIVRVGLLPAVAMSTAALNTTLAEKIAIAGSLALLSVALAIWARKPQRKGSHSQYS